MDTILKKSKGFTLIELIMVIAIIAILVSIALPAYATYRKKAVNSRFLSELKRAEKAFIAYNLDTGEYPPDVSRGVTPAGMSRSLGSFFLKPSPIGGTWDWDYKSQGGVTAGLSICTPNLSSADMQTIDSYIDDGNLTTGKFVLIDQGTTKRYIYIIER